ncbi:multicopper oxidase family protein [Alsobacter soli]|uniref:multicopper oxidase family protein n=1 Tax=Alsobacter soli TaxID=2109933 RepID=UPI001304FB44|nr:multicopper oxidase domain-containing protein [Alsobacter soli]
MKLTAAERPVVIPRVSQGGAGVELIRVSNAYTYLDDPAKPGQGTLLPPVLRPNVGDTLKVHLENRLPDVLDPHTGKTGPQVTNLHTHGMVVSPLGNGDNVFVRVFPVATPPQPAMPGVTDAYGAFDYAIRIPGGPIEMPGGKPISRAGLFWYHPHPHGLSRNQLAHGLSGLIAPGAVEDYAQCKDGGGAVTNCANLRRHFVMLRDIIVQRNGADWRIVERQDAPPVFCAAAPNGDCPEPDKKWLFTANGAVKPLLRMQGGETRLIRLANVGSDVTYRLAIEGPAPLPKVQLIAKDGVAVSGADPLPMLLMPAARAEFVISAPPQGGRWMLKTLGYNTGPAGDTWPAADLIEIEAAPVATAASQPAVQAQAVKLEPKVPLAPVKVMAAPLGGAFTAAPAARPALAPPSGAPRLHAHGGVGAAAVRIDPCAYAVLKPGQRRVITLAQDANGFMMGYGIAETGKPDVVLFPPRPVDMARIDVCVKHGGEEVWEIVNTAGEIHNFHIHQVKFMVSAVQWGDPKTGASAADCMSFMNLPAGAGQSCDVAGVTELAGHDTFPVPPNGGRLTVVIPFRNTVQIGKFVFHCHILEHEDNGMMAVLDLRR